MSRRQAKAWCFTLNNYVAEDPVPQTEDVVYMVMAKEVAASGTPHIQGYVFFKKRMQMSALKKINPRIHWIDCDGTPKENRDYCLKGEQTKAEWKAMKTLGPNYGLNVDFAEVGVLPPPQNKAGNQANAEKWAKARQAAKEGRFDDVPDDIYIKHLNNIHRIASDAAPKVPALPTTTGQWHYGPTGTGKSRSVREKYPQAFIKQADKWWDGYRGEPVVIVEDVDKYDRAMGRYCKLWCDHYAFPADMKCQGKRDIRPHLVIFTSNYHPNEIWDDEKTWKPIVRRCSMLHYNAPLMAERSEDEGE